MSDILQFGSMITIATGEYSDHHVAGPFVVERPFDMHEVAEEYKKQWTKGPNDYHDGPDPDGFLAYLNREGYIADLPCRYFHIGSYGELEIR
jgi:hypothetical protein